MDKSETFIKQCEKAEEIQAIAKGFKKATWAYQVEGEIMLAEGGNYWFRNVWLPTQSQLQGMLKQGTLESDSEIAKAFGDWCYPDFPCGIMASMEQLWLAFAQKELYGKAWSGTEWSKEGL